MPNPALSQGLRPEYEGVWGIANTARMSHLQMTDAHIFYVQSNAATATDSGNFGEDPKTPLATITAALALCQDNRGDIILVGGSDAWQYGGGSAWDTPIEENVVVDIEGVTIIGVSPDALGVPWQPATDGGTCLTFNALGCMVAGFLFQDPTYANGTGIRMVWDGLTQFGENTHVVDCFFDGSLDEAIILEYAWNVHIQHCQFQETDYGIYCDPLGSGFAYAVIEDCLFRDCAVSAISATAGCTRNTVRRCTVYNANAQAAALATNEGFNFTGGSDNMVEDCSFSCLLPVPANGDYNDLNTAAATDAWIGNHCMDGLAVTNPT